MNPPLSILQTSQNQQASLSLQALVSTLALVSDKIGECTILDNDADADSHPEEVVSNLVKVHTAATEQIVRVLSDRSNWAADTVAQSAVKEAVLELAEKAKHDRVVAQNQNTPFHQLRGQLVRVVGEWVVLLPATAQVMGRGKSAQEAIHNFNQNVVREITEQEAEAEKLSHGQQTSTDSQAPAVPAGGPVARKKPGSRKARGK